MKRIKIDIPRTSGNLYADKIKKAFIDLGWTHEMTGYLPTSTGKCSNLSFLKELNSKSQKAFLFIPQWNTTQTNSVKYAKALFPQGFFILSRFS